ncbi:hypothetical protein TI01_2443 [Lysobacter sp. A03]|nr:hypothetical protein TI01_2443 [Lysobacter sp. A03]
MLRMLLMYRKPGLHTGFHQGDLRDVSRAGGSGPVCAPE